MMGTQLADNNITFNFNMLLNKEIFREPVFLSAVILALFLILGDYLIHGSISPLFLFSIFIAVLLLFILLGMIIRLKKIQQHSRALEARLREIEDANRYKSRFLANMSHELRTPLNSIILLSQLLAENKGKNLTDKQVEYARCVQSSGHDLLGLINEILDLSKIESGKMELNVEDVTLDQIATAIRRNFSHVAEEKGLKFYVIKEANLPGTIVSDWQRIEQILNNLLSNAFKFTSEGEVILRISRADKKADLSESGLTHDQTIAFSVTDTGIGIPEDKIQFIFEPFRQVDGAISRKYGGTGLGLSISRELARLLKGEIQVTSIEGKGSEFTLYLPESCEAGELHGQQGNAAPLQRDGKTGMAISLIHAGLKDIKEDDTPVLLIEDDPIFSGIFKDYASASGFKTIIARDGEKGLAYAGKYNLKAIVLDINLQGINGWTVMSRLKEDLKTRHIPVYLVSANDSPREATRMGAAGYILKPVTVDKFERLFSDIKKSIAKSGKKLLVVEDNEVTRKLIEKLFDCTEVEIIYTSTGKEAIEKLSVMHFDCVILDLSLPDISGFEILSRIKNNESSFSSPIIVYTGKRLSARERAILDEYTECIVVKGVNSPAKLLDEVTLFLHINESELPEERRKMLRIIHDNDAILKGKKILIADDDMRNLFVLTNILESKGVNVIVAKNGIEAMNLLKDNLGIDLIIMDMMMPEKDGFMAVKEIREQPDFAELPVIALTARAMKGDRARCIEAGASDYLSKPFEKERLFSMLSAWLY